MAAGKNYITSQYEKNGWLSIDADKMVHSAINKASSLIIESFTEEAEKAGINLLNPDGSLNRRNLGSLIFPRPDLLKKQESIVYPIIIEETKAFIKNNPEKNIILNATVLYKTPELLDLCEKIVFVQAPFFTRLKRAVQRDKMPLKQILRRFWTQRKLLQEYNKSGKKIEIIKNY